MDMILDKSIDQWRHEVPVLSSLQALQETFWLNPKKIPSVSAIAQSSLGMKDILDASARLERFAPYIRNAFPQTASTGGLLESPLVSIPSMHRDIEKYRHTAIAGSLLLKCDSHLPVSGSIKARGGIYEVLKFAEEVAFSERLLAPGEDYRVFDTERFRKVFSKYSVTVGSTGNLGMSIGIMGTRLGFRVTVHMSADARQWKKDLLRSKGVAVLEHEQDYSRAVLEGRKQAQGDPLCHFVDDENSVPLFLGYSVAALRIKEQFLRQGILIDKDHPLFVYLPCGVGGGPGGVTFGIKQVFGDDAHCFFAEPTHSCCMLLGLATGCHDRVCVQDFGIDNRTEADGLAVGRASRFVGRMIEPFLSGVFTITDEHMYCLLARLADTENIRLEPSALAGMAGPEQLCLNPCGRSYIEKEGLSDKMDKAVHLVWATGGGMVPEDVMDSYYRQGKQSGARCPDCLDCNPTRNRFSPEKNGCHPDKKEKNSGHTVKNSD